MSHDLHISPLDGRYPPKELRVLFSDDRKYKGWRRFWYILAQAQQVQGAPITDEQIEEMHQHLDDPIDYETVAKIEELNRHDVIAHTDAFALVCPIAKPIIGLATTSCDTTDNVDLDIYREAIDLIDLQLSRVIDRQMSFANHWNTLPTLGSTHLKAGELVTVGKRASMWAQNFLMDLKKLRWTRGEIRFRGLKGATGTQASFLELFNGNHNKVLAMERQVAEAYGFSEIFTITGQTYPRKLDTWILGALASIALSAHKMATDIRLLVHDKEMDEPFEKGQRGSRGMPWKINPMRGERTCSLSRIPISLAHAAEITEAIQWLERSLDDSADRRVYMADSFLAVGALLKIVQNVTEGLVVYPMVIRRRINEELPFIAIGKFQVVMVKAGADYQECQQRLRDHAIEADKVVKQEGKDNDLINRIRGDSYFTPIHGQLNEILDPASFIGRCVEQVREFLCNEVDPALAPHRGKLDEKAKINV
ncbi:MAG: lyase family protein [Patescibacteria group bacterium]